LGLIASKQFKKALEFHFINSGSVAFSLKLQTEVERTLLLIQQFNQSGILVPKTNFRFISVFQYSIVYEIDADLISVLLFWDTRRNPKRLKILLEELT
jgi:hypothetical protein